MHVLQPEGEVWMIIEGGSYTSIVGAIISIKWNKTTRNMVIVIGGSRLPILLNIQKVVCR